MKIKPLLKSVLSIVTDIKIYISRTVSWISLVTNLGILFLVIEKLNSLGVIKGDLGNSIITVMVVWFIFLVVLGWVEVNKVRAPHLESMKMLELNLPQKEIYNRVREINERIKKIEEWIKEMKNDGQQKQVKQVPREDDNFSESKASPDNVDNDGLGGEKE